MGRSGQAGAAAPAPHAALLDLSCIDTHSSASLRLCWPLSFSFRRAALAARDLSLSEPPLVHGLARRVAARIVAREPGTQGGTDNIALPSEPGRQSKLRAGWLAGSWQFSCAGSPVEPPHTTCTTTRSPSATRPRRNSSYPSPADAWLSSSCECKAHRLTVRKEGRLPTPMLSLLPASPAAPRASRPPVAARATLHGCSRLVTPRATRVRALVRARLCAAGRGARLTLPHSLGRREPRRRPLATCRRRSRRS